MTRSIVEKDISVCETAWKESLSRLKNEIDPHVFAAYIEPLKINSFDQTTESVEIYAPSKLVCKHVSDNFREKITGIIASHMDCCDLSINFSVDNKRVSQNTKPKYVVVKKSPQLERRNDTRIPNEYSMGEPLNPRYNFSNFVVGNSNQFCHAAAMQVGEKPGETYNPLFIYGGVGLGKTHLLHAIGNAVIRNNSSTRVVYMSSETFTNQLIHSLRFGKMDQFKNFMRSIEVLLIDDIQFICGKERTQEEFFHTFNALYSAKHQIVMTSDKMPHEIPEIEERLRTRFAWGLTADLQAPDFETRVAILNRKANSENFDIPEEVAHLIAEKVSSNVRELEGALTKLYAVSCIQNIPISVDLAKSALKEILQPRKVTVSIGDIKIAVSNHFDIKVSDMVSKRRTRNLSYPRHVAMYLCRKHTTASYPEIGNHFGGRDHSSVIHAANVVSTKVKEDETTSVAIKEIEKVMFG